MKKRREERGKGRKCEQRGKEWRDEFDGIPVKSERYNFVETVGIELIFVPLIEAFSFHRKLPRRIVLRFARWRRFTGRYSTIKRQPRNLN